MQEPLTFSANKKNTAVILSPQKFNNLALNFCCTYLQSTKSFQTKKNKENY